MTIIDLITSGRRMEARARQIRKIMEELDYSEREATDLIDAEKERADDERREVARLDAAEDRACCHGGTRPESQYVPLGTNPNYRGDE